MSTDLPSDQFPDSLPHRIALHSVVDKNPTLNLTLCSLNDLALLQARSANLHSSDAAINADANFLDIRPQPYFRVLV